MTLRLGMQTYQILTNYDKVCIPSLSSIFLAVKVIYLWFITKKNWMSKLDLVETFEIRCMDLFKCLIIKSNLKWRSFNTSCQYLNFRSGIQTKSHIKNIRQKCQNWKSSECQFRLLYIFMIAFENLNHSYKTVCNKKVVLWFECPRFNSNLKWTNNIFTYKYISIKTRVSFQYLHNGVWYHPEIWKFESGAKIHDRHSWVKRHYLST